MPKGRTLWDLTRGESATVTAVTAKSAMRRRLQDIGLVPGTRVKSVNRGMMGGPTAYLVRGAVIALRRKDAESVTVDGA